MSESKKESSFLGKKRESEKLEDNSNNQLFPSLFANNNDKKKKKLDDAQKGKNEVEDSSDSSDDGQPIQSLFGKNEKGFTGGLFGNLDEPGKSTSLFGGQKEGTGLFSNTGGSLFGNLKNDKKEEKKGSLFGEGLFDFSNVNKKEEKDENEEDNEGDDNIGKSNSPKHEYNPEKEEENKTDKDNYIKRYAKKFDNVLFYEKKEKDNVYVSKGEGFLIIETQEKEKDSKKERFARILYRNTIGGIIFQGLLNDQINKCITYEKKLKHICNFIFLVKESEESNKLSLGQAKAPFTTIEEINKFSDAYNNSIKYIRHEIDEF